MWQLCAHCAGRLVAPPAHLPGFAWAGFRWLHSENFSPWCPVPFTGNLAEPGGAYVSTLEDVAELDELAAAAEASTGGAGPACWCIAYHFTNLAGREVCVHGCHNGRLDPGPAPPLDDLDELDLAGLHTAPGAAADPYVFGPADGPQQDGAELDEPGANVDVIAELVRAMAPDDVAADLDRLRLQAFAGMIDPAGFLAGLDAILSGITMASAPPAELDDDQAAELDHPWVYAHRVELDDTQPGGRRWWLYLRRPPRRPQ